MKVLSIVIPVYNTEKYIRRCLDSVLLKEVLNDIEVIVVSDGSKDNSVKIAREYKEKYPDTVILIEKENGGHGSTINVGIKKATGKYFRVLDSDDWFDCLNFVEFVHRLRNEDVDLIIDNYQKEFVYEGNSVEINQEKLKNNKVYSFDKFDLTQINYSYFAMANSTYKTTVIRESGLELFEKCFYVDMQYNVVPITKVDSFKFYELSIYRYFIGRKEQSVNLESFVRNRKHHEKVMKFLIDYCVENRNKISTNKYNYIETITKLMLVTHYQIFCIHFKDKSKACEEVKEFDKYLFDRDEKIYKLMNEIDFIRENRNNDFILVKSNKSLISKIIRMYRKKIGGGCDQ